MRKVSVCVPITGYVYKELEVEDNATDEEILDVMYDECTLEDIGEWDMVDHVCQGNVFYGTMNDYEITDI